MLELQRLSDSVLPAHSLDPMSRGPGQQVTPEPQRIPETGNGAVAIHKLGPHQLHPRFHKMSYYGQPGRPAEINE